MCWLLKREYLNNPHLFDFSSGETDTNRFDSHPNHENRSHYEGPPLQGFSEACRAGSFFVSYRSAAQEAPSGAAAFIVSDGKRGNNFRIISEYYDFHRISSLF